MNNENEIKQETLSAEGGKGVTEAHNQQKEAAEAAKHRREQREELPADEVGREHPHNDSGSACAEEKAPRITIGQIAKYIGLGIFIFVLILLIYRIVNQKKDYSDLFVWTDEAISVYNREKKLTVWVQDMSSFTYTLERDENNLPTETYEYTYYPYSQSDTPDDLEDEDPFYGVFMVGDPMYIEETQQFIVTFRVNRRAGEKVQAYYSLSAPPSGDSYCFLISDGYNVYTDYEYITFEKDSYFYYRLVFNDLPYGYIRDLRNVERSDIKELRLAVYYSGLFHIDSPLDTISVSCNLIAGEAYDIDDALPAEKSADLKKGPVYTKEEN